MGLCPDRVIRRSLESASRSYSTPQVAGRFNQLHGRVTGHAKTSTNMSDFVNQIVFYSGLGQKDRAFEFPERANQEKSPDLAYFLRADLRIDPLHADARFPDRLRRMNFPE
jgi:hypothetical protein